MAIATDVKVSTKVLIKGWRNVLTNHGDMFTFKPIRKQVIN